MASQLPKHQRGSSTVAACGVSTVTYKNVTKMQNQLQLGNKPKEKGNMATTSERGSTNVNYYKEPVNEDHIEWWERESACTGEAAEHLVFKQCLRAGHGGR